MEQPVKLQALAPAEPKSNSATTQLQPAEPVKQSSYIPPPPGSRPCVVCRDVHLNCDRMRPCSRCVRLGRQKECVDPPVQPRGRPATDTTDPAIIRRRKNNRNPDHVPQKKIAKVTIIQQPQVELPASLDESIAHTNRQIEAIMAQGRLAYYWTKNTIIGCTPEFADYLGYKQSELIGVSTDVLQPPELVEVHHRKIKAFLDRVPEDAVEIEIIGNSLYMTRTGRRFEPKIRGSLYLQMKTVTLAVVRVLGINRDNIPPGSTPSKAAPYIKLRRASGEVCDYGHIGEAMQEIYEAFARNSRLMIASSGLPNMWVQQQHQYQQLQLQQQPPVFAPPPPLAIPSPIASPSLIIRPLMQPHSILSPMPLLNPATPTTPSSTLLENNTVSSAASSSSITSIPPVPPIESFFDGDDLSLTGILFM